MDLLQDPDCREDHECKLGPKGVKQCRDVCEDKLCGPNANCLGEVHKAICECLPGFVFDGTGCHGKFIFIKNFYFSILIFFFLFV